MNMAIRRVIVNILRSVVGEKKSLVPESGLVIIFSSEIISAIKPIIPITKVINCPGRRMFVSTSLPCFWSCACLSLQFKINNEPMVNCKIHADASPNLHWRIMAVKAQVPTITRGVPW